VDYRRAGGSGSRHISLGIADQSLADAAALVTGLGHTGSYVRRR